MSKDNSIKENKKPLDFVNAVMYGHTDAVAEFLNIGANVEEKNGVGETVLIAAVRFGYTKIVDLLLNGGANVNNSSSKSTALINAAR